MSSGATVSLSLQRIASDHGVIDPAFRDTPQFECQPLGDALGCTLFVKVEAVNPIRSFKARGAEFFVSRLERRMPLVCATAGNFGQGMAHAARRRGIPLTIFAAADANPFKVERMRALGADVKLTGRHPDEVHAAAIAHARETGDRLVEDGREAAIAEGAGTIALELLRTGVAFDAVVVPVGDGALAAGIGTVFKSRSPATRVVGACAAGSPAMARSWRDGRVVSADVATIADTLAIRTPFAESLARLRAVVDELVEVDDPALIEAMRLAHRSLGIVLEPGGAAAIAALLAQRERFRGLRVAAILTGGNITDDQVRQWLQR